MKSLICLMFFVSTFALMTQVLAQSVSKFCPQMSLISPCTCKNNAISCSKVNTVNLSRMFGALRNALYATEKHFISFTLEDTLVTELKANTFKDITFDKIYIKNNNYLNKIDVNAFTTTNLVTNYLLIQENPQLTEGKDNSLFDVLSKFVNIEEISLKDNKISQIPEKAFKPINGYQDSLKRLSFQGKSIAKIGNNAFKNLKSLYSLMIYDTIITKIPDMAFNIEGVSKVRFYLYLSGNPWLSSYGFAPTSLSVLGRPTLLILGFSLTPKQITFLDEITFRPFLMANAGNQINMLSAQFDCDDCRNYWLTKYPTLLSKINDLRCGNGKAFKDNSNFAKCVDLMNKTIH